MRSKPQQAGFSLPELILVLVFICIIVAIAVPNVSSTLRAAREGAAVGNVKSLVSAQALFFRGDGRFGILDELFVKKLLSEGQFTRNAPGPSGSPTKGATEEISDGVYQYSFRYTTDSTGYTLDADPKKDFRATYRRFRFRVNQRAVSAGASGSKEVMLVAKPSVSSPAATAYKAYNP